MRLLLLAALAGCGPSAKPAPAPPANTQPPVPVAKAIDCEKILDKVLPIMDLVGAHALTREQRTTAVDQCRSELATNPQDPLMLCIDAAVDTAAVKACMATRREKPSHARRPEAMVQLNKLAKNAKVYYATNGEYPRGTAAQLPSQGCCGGPQGKCAVTDAWTKDPVWAALDFQIDEPNLFQYRYTGVGKTFHAEAIGDLDCDGTFITYALDGTSPGGNAAATLTEPPPNSD